MTEHVHAPSRLRTAWEALNAGEGSSTHEPPDAAEGQMRRLDPTFGGQRSLLVVVHDVDRSNLSATVASRGFPNHRRHHA